MHINRIANLLGAAALTVTDRAVHASAGAAGISPSAAAALITITTDPGLGVTEIGARIGLSQPAAVRMLDGLVTRDLVVRRKGAGRAVHVHPTPTGRRAAKDILTARQNVLAELLERLTAAQREALETGLTAVLDALYADVRSEYVLCRMCDRAACRHEGAPCPVGSAARGERGRRRPEPGRPDG